MSYVRYFLLIMFFSIEITSKSQSIGNSTIVIEPSKTWANQCGYVKTDSKGQKEVDWNRIKFEALFFHAVQNDMIRRFNEMDIKVKDYFEVMENQEKSKRDRLLLGAEQSDFDMAQTSPQIDYSIQFTFPLKPTADGAKIGFEFVSLDYSIVDMVTQEKLASGIVRTKSTPQGYYDMEKLILNALEIEFPNIESQIRKEIEKKALTGNKIEVQFIIPAGSEFDMYEECGDFLLYELIQDYMKKISHNNTPNKAKTEKYYLKFNPLVPPDQSDLIEWLTGGEESALRNLLKPYKLIPKPTNDGLKITVELARSSK